MPLCIEPSFELNDSSPRIPIEWIDFHPAIVCDQGVEQIRRHRIRFGNQQLELGELFRVTGSASDKTWILKGDFSTVHHIGSTMTEGTIHVEGDAGRHVGSGLMGGTIEVSGSVGDWVGAEMKKGLIDVRGDAGDHAGGAYIGSTKGMRGGTLIVHGNVGSEAGRCMRRGLIAIGGGTSDLLGFEMKAGTILVKGRVGRRIGAGMRRGTICILDQPGQLQSQVRFDAGDNKEPQRKIEDAQKNPASSHSTSPEFLLSTFRGSYRGSFSFWPLLVRQLKTLGFPLEPSDETLQFQTFHGDLLYQGRGEVLVGIQQN